MESENKLQSRIVLFAWTCLFQRKPEESPVKEVKKMKQNDGQANDVHEATEDSNGYADSTEVKRWETQCLTLLQPFIAQNNKSFNVELFFFAVESNSN